jgi:hypothetical protein
MATDRMRDPKVVAGIVAGALLVAWLIGRR